jgi:type I restriction enzyme S subunit
MTEWRATTLSDACQRVDYGYTASASNDPELPRFLRITDIAGPHIDWSKVPGCAVDSAKLKKYAIDDGDIVVARTGATVGYAKRIRNHPTAVFASYLVRFRPRKGVVPAFLGAVVESQSYKTWVQQNAGGAAQPNASAKLLGAFPLLLPDEGTQRRIGLLLDALTDLVENNRRRVEVLEEMARVIYREWFVYFRYPGHENATLIKSALGPIPEGWEIGRVDAHFVLQRGFDLPAKEREPGFVPVIGASGRQGFHSAAKAPGPGLVTGRSGTVGEVTYVPRDFWPLNTSLWVKEFRLSTPRSAYFLLSSLDLARAASGAAVPTLNRNVVHALPVVCPPRALIEDWDSVAAPIFDSIEGHRLQSECLVRLRDLLVPKLMTGEIDVSSLDLDVLVEDSVA